MTATATHTHRRWHSWRPKRTAFLNWETGVGHHKSGAFLVPEAAALPELLRWLPADIERLMVTGPRIGGTLDELRAWLIDPGPGWRTAPEGHYLEDYGQFTLRYVSDVGDKVSIHRAASWFGEGEYTPADAHAAWERLAEEVAGRFAGGVLLATPATTGRDLFVRSMGENVYPIASPEHQDLIRSTTGQGRIELRPSPADVPGIMPGLAEYDGRLMYGALCWGLGSGVRSDESFHGPAAIAHAAATFAANPQLRARYLIRFAVPRGWDHVGMVGVWTGSGWTYPSTPGEEAETWVDGSELALLVKVSPRWRVAILRRLELHDTDGPGPLDRWAKKLVLLRLRLTESGETLAAAGARSILLHAIGAFMGRRHLVTHTAPITDTRAVPRNAVGLRIEGETLVWGEPRPPAWPEMAHPEWAAAIWARCRARMLAGPGYTGALNARPESVVAFRTDALYLTERQNWADDGKAGRLRLASWSPGPLPWPSSVAELLRMRDEARA